MAKWAASTMRVHLWTNVQLNPVELAVLSNWVSESSPGANSQAYSQPALPHLLGS
jgi:hypothetical protein